MKLVPKISIEADLHCHTLASDGQLSPRELVCQASKLGLTAIGITDHDTIGGWTEARLAGKEYHVDTLAGIELSTEWEGKTVHILGYEIDGNSNYLQERLQELIRKRNKQIQEILTKLKGLNIPISLEDVLAQIHGESAGRPHIAQVLINSGYAANTKEAFKHYLGKGAPAYAPRHKLTPEEGIEIIRKTFGVAILAHPGKGCPVEMIEKWVQAGLQGIEVYHPDHSEETEVKWREIADQYYLLKTGGSDFHGLDRKPGIEIGSRGVRYTVVHEIRRLAAQNRQEKNNRFL